MPQSQAERHRHAPAEYGEGCADLSAYNQAVRYGAHSRAWAAIRGSVLELL